MINNVSPYSHQVQFGQQNRAKAEMTKALKKADAAVSKVYDDDNRISKTDIAIGGGVAGLGIFLRRGLKAVKAGGDVLKTAAKQFAKNKNKNKSPFGKHLGGLFALITTMVGLVTAASVTKGSVTEEQ